MVEYRVYMSVGNHLAVGDAYLRAFTLEYWAHLVEFGAFFVDDRALFVEYRGSFDRILCVYTL